jgi:hypothetical protein
VIITVTNQSALEIGLLSIRQNQGLRSIRKSNRGMQNPHGNKPWGFFWGEKVAIEKIKPHRCFADVIFPFVTIIFSYRCAELIERSWGYWQKYRLCRLSAQR